MEVFDYYEKVIPKKVGKKIIATKVRMIRFSDGEWDYHVKHDEKIHGPWPLKANEKSCRGVKI